jgi:hypothetical protein
MRRCRRCGAPMHLTFFLGDGGRDYELPFCLNGHSEARRPPTRREMAECQSPATSRPYLEGPLLRGLSSLLPSARGAGRIPPRGEREGPFS